jgi:hypothetical protein
MFPAAFAKALRAANPLSFVFAVNWETEGRLKWMIGAGDKFATLA